MLSQVRESGPGDGDSIVVLNLRCGTWATRQGAASGERSSKPRCPPFRSAGVRTILFRKVYSMPRHIPLLAADG